MIGKLHSIDTSSLGQVLRPSPRHDFGALVGVSASTRAAFALLERSARCDATVLLEGETGTGKEVAASSIHHAGARRTRPFVVADCSAIAAPLLESELFGHEKGAFTGAVTTRVGAFEEASGGTIFLDEIGELPLDLQPKLLRVLEQRKVRRIGSNVYRNVPMRIIAATNRDLLAEVRRGRFRQDLYYRLAVVRIRLPPLRERPEDFPVLVEQILRSLGVEPHAEPGLTSPQFLKALRSAAWPGNVRELRNYLEQCLAFGAPPPLAPAPVTVEPALHRNARWERGEGAGFAFLEARKSATLHWERQYLLELMRRHDQSVEEAARAAGIGRSYLYRLLSRHELLVPRHARSAPAPANEAGASRYPAHVAEPSFSNGPIG